DAVLPGKVASRFGIRLDEIEISPDIVDLLPRIVDVLDEPIGDPAAINTLLMCQAARERGVKVILSGMGADELFGGYRKHLACVLAGRDHRAPAWVRHGLVQPTVERLPVSTAGRGLRYARWAKRFLTFAELPEEPRFRRSYTLYDPGELAALISPDLADHVGRVVEEHSDIYHDNSLQDEINRMCLADARMFLPGLNLAYTDRASMAASVEVRVPFVDPVVAQAAFSIDGSGKIRRRQGKVALKRVAENWLPHEIAYRPKASFSAPLRAWVRGDLAEVVRDVLVGGELVQSGMIRRDALLRLVQEDNDGREDRSKQIWQLLTLGVWYRHAQALGVAAWRRGPAAAADRCCRGGFQNPPRQLLRTDEADSAKLQIRRAHRPRRAGPRMPAGRCPGAVVVLPHLHRHRDDESERGQDVDGRQGAGAARPGTQGPRLRRAAGRGRHLQEGDDPARLLHATRLLALRGRDRRGSRRRGVPRRAARRRRRQRVRPARRVQLGSGQPVRRGPE